MSASNPGTDPLIIAVDQGTSSTKALALAADGRVLARAQIAISQSHPRPGWVEQDATEILTSVLDAIARLLAELKRPAAVLALSTQRESAIAWDRATGEPLGPMLGWQDRRTAARALKLRASGDEDWIRARTGLPVDPMFSALKFECLLDTIDPDRTRTRAGKIALGTVDSYLADRLTGHHTIEAGNASRTQLLDLDRVAWDEELLALFRIPAAALPRILPSDALHQVSFDQQRPAPLGPGFPAQIAAVLGDSHAALFGHGVRAPGAVKVTYGTGSSVMGLLDGKISTTGGLTRTLAWQIGDRPAQAFEGNILSSGSTLVWAGQLLGLEPPGLIELARNAEPQSAVNLVPAFAGLGAPWWSERAQATLSGFTLGTGRAEVARAAVDAVVLQIEDLLEAAQHAGATIATVLADGGPTANDWLMQLQADYSGRAVKRARVAELSALGVAQLAAQAIGVADGQAPAAHDEFIPNLDPALAAKRRHGWNVAVARVLTPDPPSVGAQPHGQNPPDPQLIDQQS